MKVFWMILFAMQGFAAVQTIHTLEEARIEMAEPGTWVIFDVDEVLITAKDALLHPASGHHEAWKQVPLDQFEHYLSLMFSSAEYSLINPRMTEWLRSLQEREIPTMALTACWTGKLGSIPSMVDWRIAQLEKFGVDFTSFSSDEFVFAELVDHKSSPPLFKNGILFCGDFYSREQSTKGKLLGVFLDRLGRAPEQVIFIDDDLKNVEAVDHELAQRGIPCSGFHLKRTPPPIDEKIANHQMKILLEEGRWISDAEAKKAFPHKPPILTTGAIIEIYLEDQFKGIVLIERGKAPFGKALPGGKVEYGETVECAVRREMLEEVNLELSDLRQFHVYSDPQRDFRHHSVEVTYVAKAFQLPYAGDDAAKAFLVPLEEIPWEELAFDHAQILKDYISWRIDKEALHP